MNGLKKEIFDESNGLWYTLGEDDLYYPNLVLSKEEDDYQIGKFGMLRADYLKNHRRLMYFNLLTSGRLHDHLAETDKSAKSLFSRLVKDIAEAQGMVEELKASNQMEWVGRMNNVRHSAEEIVLADIVYA
jgi:hypothetical protein